MDAMTEDRIQMRGEIMNVRDILNARIDELSARVQVLEQRAAPATVPDDVLTTIRRLCHYAWQIPSADDEWRAGLRRVYAWLDEQPPQTRPPDGE